MDEGTATHPSILPWRIPQTEEPGGLQSMESQSQTPLKRLSMHAYTTNLYIYTFTLFRQPWDPPTLSLSTNKDPALHIKITQFR